MLKRLALFALLSAGFAGVSSPALAARLFCCNDDNGVRACGDVLPEVCRNKAYSEINERGQKVRTQEAPLTEAQQAARDVEQKKKREADRLALEQNRRDQALMSTYAKESDLDNARDRQIAEVERSMKQAQEKIDAATKAKAKLAKDGEFYKNKPLPADLKDSMRRNDTEIQTLTTALENKKKEIEDIKARFEADRARLRELRKDDKK
ncbi:MAG TPA: hypothetical protein VFW68_10000 [Rhodocyclaceae bacterium]|nr:hypothetical protein [Rhodocyclaceae bacterium]